MANRVSRIIGNRHLWIVVITFAICIIAHYPQQILATDSPSLFSFLGLTRHAIERVFLLLPIAYAGFFLGIKAGLASIAIAFAIMLPRVFLVSPYPEDALFETFAVIFAGGLTNMAFHMQRRAMSERERAEGMLRQLIDGSGIPMFVINKEHKVVYWNRAIAALTRVEKGDVRGTDGQWRGFYPEKRPMMADLVVDGASIEEIQAHYPGRCKRSELIEDAWVGEEFFPALGEAGKWLNFTASPIRDADGKIVRAIETLQDVTERKTAEKNVRQYSEKITMAHEEERRRIATDLHDDTAQELVALSRRLDKLVSSAKLSAKDMSSLEQIRQQADRILEGVRRFSQDLRPSILDDLGLVPALEWLASVLGDYYGVTIDVGLVGSMRRLSPDTELVLFRIAQEGLTNVCKHSGALRAWVTVGFDEGKVILTVKDNGRGFELPKTIEELASADKLGLAGMQERARLIGGGLTLYSQIGEGTTVTVEVPGV